MRTISSNLLTAQRSQHPHAYVRMVVTEPVSPYTVYTFDTAGYSGALKRIVNVNDYEEVYGGAATIRLANYDQYFTAKDLHGWKVELSYGFRVSTGPDVYEWSTVRTLFVWSQEDDSSGKNAYTDLNCLDYWWQIAANETLSAGEQIEGELTDSMNFVMGETITGSPSGATGILVGVGFDKILVTAISGTFVGDTSASGAGGGSITISAVTAVVAASGASANKTTTIENIINAVLPGSLNGVSVDEDDPNNTVTTYMPLLVTDPNESARNIIAQLLQMTQCGARLEDDDYLHILYLDTTDAAQETYNSVHAHYVQVRERAVIMPNAVLFLDKMPDALGNAPTYSGTAQHDESVALLGSFPTTQVNPSITADGDVPGGAERFAKNWIAQEVAAAFQGSVTAPMNIRQELYDMVQVEDDRSGITVKGRVGRIDRLFTYGKFQITIRLGGIASDYTGVPGWEDLPTDIKGVTELPAPPTLVDWSKIPWETILPSAIQGFDLEGIDFSAPDWDTVAWTSGYIRFFDGTSQAILAGNTGNLSSADIYNIWFDLADASPNVLKVGTEAQYLAAWTENVGLLCICQRSLSGTAIKANFIPSRGKMPLITPDRIDMTGTANYDFGGGTYYKALFNNQVSAGHIYLSSATYYASETYNIAGKEYAIKRQSSAPTGSYDYLWWDTTTYVMYRWNGTAWETMKGEWYNKTGVLIDSTKGIRLYGQDMAFGTFANESDARAGTNWKTKMDSSGRIVGASGAVWIDDYGFTIKGLSSTDLRLRFLNNSSVMDGAIYLDDAGHFVVGARNTGRDLYLLATGTGAEIAISCQGQVTIQSVNDMVFVQASVGLIVNGGWLDLHTYSTPFKPYVVNNGSQPTINDLEMRMWVEYATGDVYLMYRNDAWAGGTVKVKLT